MEKRDLEKQKVLKFIISSIVESNIRYIGKMGGAEERIRLLRKSNDEMMMLLDEPIIIQIRLGIMIYNDVLTDLVILQKQIIEDIRLLTGLLVEKVILKIDQCFI